MGKNFSNWFGLFENKSVPPIDEISELTRDGQQKAYIPKFMYKPPFGYPRYVDLPNVRRLASTPYVEMCITTIVDEISAVEWKIILDDDVEESDQKLKELNHIKSFFENPNTNKESFEEIRRKYIRDILEIDAGVINKVFNSNKQMVEIVTRDGATFTKNPDIYGMMTDREDIIFDTNIQAGGKEARLMEPGWITAADAREKAAYFQYGWITGARPVPFGKKEIVWLERNPRTDSIYGRSPVEILASTIQTLIYAVEHDLEYFNDNSIPKGVLGLEGADSDSIKAFKDQWKEQQRVKDSAGNWKKQFHQIPIVGKTPQFTRIQFSNAELELLEGQKWWAKMVWACFGCTSAELGYTEDAKGMGNQVVQSNIFRKRAINPLLRLEEYRINKEIISEFYENEKNKFIKDETKRLKSDGIVEVKARINAELKAEEKLRNKEFPYQGIKFQFMMFDVDEEMKKSELYKSQIDSGIKTVNEIRVEEGLEEVEWGDDDPKRNQGNNFNFNGDPNDPRQREMNKLEEQSKPEEKKNIETKPFAGYTNFQDCVNKNRDKKDPDAYCATIMRQVEGKSNPLILGEFEQINEDRLKRSIIYLINQNEKKIKELIEQEAGKNKLTEIKNLTDLVKAIKNLLTFTGLKRISDIAIENNFMEGWDSSEKQLNRNFLVNKEAITFIQDYTFNNIKGMTEEIGNDLRQELERGIIAGEGVTKLKERVGKVFNVGKNRAEMIARTESNRAENQGKLLAMKASGEKYMKQWSTHEDDRTSEICKRLDGQTVGLNENFIDPKSGWEGPAPPSHVNCRSAVLFVRKEEKKE